jgi:hypothetical protein
VAARIVPSTIEFMTKHPSSAANRRPRGFLRRWRLLLIEVDGNQESVLAEAEKIRKIVLEHNALMRLTQNPAEADRLGAAARYPRRRTT